ncbi:MAG: hypothetical protein EA402_10505 [Planctomycetota bacterium]|nr:MAG: hypothetical protein EA402_10505 [Planctomycetota bacterium]
MLTIAAPFRPSSTPAVRCRWRSWSAVVLVLLLSGGWDLAAAETTPTGPDFVLSLDLGRLHALVESRAELAAWREGDGPQAKRWFMEAMQLLAARDNRLPPLAEMIASTRQLRLHWQLHSPRQIAAVDPRAFPQPLGAPELRVDLGPADQLTALLDWLQTQPESALLAASGLTWSATEGGRYVRLGHPQLLGDAWAGPAADELAQLHLEFRHWWPLSQDMGFIWRQFARLMQALGEPLSLSGGLLAPAVDEAWRSEFRLRFKQWTEPSVDDWHRWRRQDSHASLLLPMPWSSLPMLFEGIENLEGVWWTWLIASWPELAGEQVVDSLLRLSPLLLAEAWAPSPSRDHPQLVLLLPLRPADDGHAPLAAALSRLFSLLGDIDADHLPTAEGIWQWRSAEDAWQLRLDQSALSLAIGAGAWQRYQAATPEAPTAPLLAALRVHSAAWWPSVMAQTWRWWQGLDQALGFTREVAARELVEQLPRGAAATEVDWWQRLPADLQQRLRHWSPPSLAASDFFATAWSWYLPGPHAQLSRPALVFRDAQGWYIQQAWLPLRGPLQEAEAAALLQPMERSQGPELAALEILRMGPDVYLDSRLLPSLERMLNHLPPDYLLRVDADERGVRLQEEGLPLLAVAAAGLGLQVTTEMQRRVFERRERRLEELSRRLLAAEPQRHALYRELALAIERHRGEEGELPHRPSLLFERGFIDIETVRQLLGAADTAEEGALIEGLDGLGRWYALADQRRWRQAVWIIPFDQDWLLEIGAWDNLRLVPRPDGAAADVAQ